MKLLLLIVVFLEAVAAASLPASSAATSSSADTAVPSFPASTAMPSLSMNYGTLGSSKNSAPTSFPGSNNASPKNSANTAVPSFPRTTVTPPLPKNYDLLSFSENSAPPPCPACLAASAFLINTTPAFSTGATASIFGPEDFTVTVDMIDGALQSAMNYREHLPKLLVEQLQNTTTQEKEELVTFLNKLQRGQITEQVNSLEDLVRLTEKEAPISGRKARILFNDYMDRFGKLTKQARDFLEKWERSWFETVQKTKTDKVAFFGEMLQMLPECLNEVKDFTPETWSSLMEQFPEVYSMWSEHKQMFGNFDEITQELPTDNKTTESPKVSKQSMELNVQNLLPTGSLKV